MRRFAGYNTSVQQVAGDTDTDETRAAVMSASKSRYLAQFSPPLRDAVITKCVFLPRERSVTRNSIPARYVIEFEPIFPEGEMTETANG